VAGKMIGGAFTATTPQNLAFSQPLVKPKITQTLNSNLPTQKPKMAPPQRRIPEEDLEEEDEEEGEGDGDYGEEYYENRANVSKMIQQMFRRKNHRGEFDDIDDDMMETGFGALQNEERKSLRMASREDADEEKKEKHRKKQKQLKKKV